MRCGENKEMNVTEEVPTKNGAIMVKGTCKDCGCKMCKFKKKE
ncbi:MAG: hypothetical protein CEN91_119 [Candidatus Berkelbacteria bacterium Licking1014_85]|uniref:DUF5679 domain-containing protein n=1 Tax=Candidatus Berkelbacteria bacterium Licking1014_85 TaxID=2017148 RepID=A0A554LLP7_9BACT|nr:MAG: hypothetical protein CEN91_119 [Candidatus Berkelbacteria bacterium Licking1014_85]